MAFSKHTIIGGALVGIVLAAIIGGIAITGGPGEARARKEDNARLSALSETVIALACYTRAKGSIPEDLGLVEGELADITSDAHKADNCESAQLETDPATGDYFALRRDNGEVTHICANFATGSNAETSVSYRYGSDYRKIADLTEDREAGGEHCFQLALTADFGDDLFD